MKLKNLPYKLLLLFGRILDQPSLSPVNRFGQLVYKVLVFPLARVLILKFSKIEKARIELRRSLVKGDGFNLAFSDIDFTFIFSGQLKVEEADQILSAVAKVKKFFPMLGEVEVFSDVEYKLLQKNLAVEQELLSFLRDIKKIVWMEKSVRKSSYHEYKIRRAIKKSLNNLGEVQIQIKDILPQNNLKLCGHRFLAKLRSILKLGDSAYQYGSMEDELSFFSREYDAQLGGKMGDTLKLSHKDLVGLMAVSPFHSSDPIQVVALTQGFLQRRPDLQQKRKVVLEYEWLYALASPRVHPQWRNESPLWPPVLKKQIEELT